MQQSANYPPDSQSTRSRSLPRQWNVYRLAAALTLVCVLTIPGSAAEPPETDHLLRSIENRYNRAPSLKLDFSEVYTAPGRPSQHDAGVLYLRKPSRMRWDYSTPAGKVFLSDGKDVFLYTPGDGRAQKSKLKESEDMHAPIAFLLGKLDFGKEFKSFELRNRGSEQWIIAEPKSSTLAYTKVEFQATTDGEIHQVRVTGQDQSQLDFTFSNEQLNAQVSPDLFTFHAPPGVPVVEAGQ
jgi:outer membrane lipoprotein carrier protein